MATIKVRKIGEDAVGTDGADEQRRYLRLQVLDGAGFTHEISVYKSQPVKEQVIAFLRDLAAVLTYEIE